MINALKFKNRGVEKTIRNKDVFQRFVEWNTLTMEEKTGMGITTSRDFAMKYGISEITLSKWKKRQDFQSAKREAMIDKLSLYTPDVLQALIKRCMRYGMSHDIEFYLIYVEGWDKKRVLEVMGEIKLGDADFRSLVERLPENEQKEFYDVFTRFLERTESTLGSR